MGDAQSCNVGDHLSPGTVVPFALTCCGSSRKKEKSVIAHDIKPHSLLILSLVFFLLVSSCHCLLFRSL